MNKDDYALFKYSIIAPFINGTSNTKSVRSFCDQACKKEYSYKGDSYTFKSSTIRNWISKYKKQGYDDLIRKTRSDKTKPRVLDDDILARVNIIKNEYPKIRTTALYKILIDEGYFIDNEISLRTFERYVANCNFISLNSEYERKAYTFEFSNDSWQCDTTSGPYIVIKGQKYKTYIMVFIDDHSRLIVGARAFFNDNALNMQTLLKEAIKLYGIPKQLYADNGGPYSNKQLSIICARLGINLKNARAYDPQAKGKVERFNRTLKDTWMNTFNWNNIKSLDELNKMLNKHINKYNNTFHKSLNSTPNEVYFKDNGEIRYVDLNKLESYFYHTITRKVSNVGTVKIENNVYEIDYSLVKRTIELTYDPFDLSKVYYNGKEYGLLDSVSNSKKRRKKNVDYSKIVNKEDEEILEYEGQ